VEDYLTDSDQWEALKRWLRENGAWMVAGVIIGVGALFGYRWWEERQATRAHTAHARYADVLTALATADKARAVELTDQLRREYADTPYADHADLILARAHVDWVIRGCCAPLRSVMETSNDPSSGSIARDRLARVQLAQDRPDDALATSRVPTPVPSAPASMKSGRRAVQKGRQGRAWRQYRAALTAKEPGLVDTGLLQLKINDLGAAEPEAAVTPAPAEASQCVCRSPCSPRPRPGC
jgi:predicted negative regulator of RcsB-dependent stress response